jgi:cell division control protein 24
VCQQKYNHLINAKSELPAFLIKPIQRICKYPLLLDVSWHLSLYSSSSFEWWLRQQLLKKSSPVDYPHYEELKAGSAAAKRITDKINEAQRRAENLQTVQNLASRVDDWKGHHVSQFGELLLEDIFIVTKSEVDREYHVFLFERIILCCKEDTSVAGNSNNKKASKNNSILKKPQANGSSAGGSKKKMTPLFLKGRIYLNNVTEAKVVSPGNLTSLLPLLLLNLARFLLA